MKKLAILAVAGLLTAACTPQERVAGGAVIGGATGAGIGALATGGSTSGAVVGGLVGAGTGALVGAASNQRHCTAYDRWGRPYSYRC